MKRRGFFIVIILGSTLFSFFLVVDDLFVSDRGLRQVYESALLAIILGTLSITASKYYAEESTRAVIQEIKRVESKFEQKIDSSKSEFEQQPNSNQDTTHS